jgi:hypothetical protein
MRPAPPLALAALLLAAPACMTPYPDLAARLDVGRAVRGAPYVMVAGQEVRLLVLEEPTDAASPAPFALTRVTGGWSVVTLQGTWTEDRSLGKLTLRGAMEFVLPDERNKAVINRVGASRREVDQQQVLDVGPSGDQLVLSGGDGSAAGTWTLLATALSRLGGMATDPTCAFQVANLTVRSAQARVPGFGSPAMVEYLDGASFQGTAAGALHVSLRSLSTPWTTIAFTGYVDFAGVTLDGAQVSQTNTSGEGNMSGVIGFALQPGPAAPDDPAPPPVQGTIDYGGVLLGNGAPLGGGYAVAVQGGANGVVPAIGPLTPTTAACLGL